MENNYEVTLNYTQRDPVSQTNKERREKKNNNFNLQIFNITYWNCFIVDYDGDFNENALHRILYWIAWSTVSETG